MRQSHGILEKEDQLGAAVASVRQTDSHAGEKLSFLIPKVLF